MKRIALFFALAVAAIACTPEETVTPEIKVVPAESELLLPTEGGELTIKFNTNVDWTASVKEADAKEWCSLSPATGKPGDNTLKVIALENEGTENRTVTVVITAMEATAEVVVTQLQKDALVLTGNKSFEVPYQGQNLEFAVSHNSELKAEADVEWITEVKAKAVEESKLTFAVAPNTGEARTGKITFTAGSLKEVVEVKQAAWVLEFTVTPEDETKTFEAEGGEYAVTVVANVEYTVNVPENDWLTVADAEGVYTFTAAANTTPAAREVTVTIAPKDEKLAEAAVAIKMNQKGAGAKLVVSDEDKADKWLPCTASTFEIVVDTNIEVEVTCGESAEGVEPWITFTEAAGVYTFAAVANTAFDPRSAIVTIAPIDEAYADLGVSINVFQKGLADEEYNVFLDVAESVGAVSILKLAIKDDHLLVFTGAAIHSFNKNTGAYEQMISIPEGFTFQSFTSDEAGNILFAADATCPNGPVKIFAVSSLDELSPTLTPIVEYVPNAFWGGTVGNIRVRGDIKKDALVTATLGTCNYLLYWEFKDGELQEASSNWSAFGGTDLNGPRNGCAAPVTANLEDGFLFIGYDGRYQLMRTVDLNEWTIAYDDTVGGTVDGSGNNYESVATMTHNSKHYAAFERCTHWWTSTGGAAVLVDVTDPASPQHVYSHVSNYYSEGGNHSDIILESGENTLNMYVIDAQWNKLSKISIIL